MFGLLFSVKYTICYMRVIWNSIILFGERNGIEIISNKYFFEKIESIPFPRYTVQCTFRLDQQPIQNQ